MTRRTLCRYGAQIGPFWGWRTATADAAQVPQRPADRMAYWMIQRRGANHSPGRFRPSVFQAASEAGIQFLRLNLDGVPSSERDFLIGNADAYKAIPPADLAQLRLMLDAAEKHGVKVVLSMFSLPGCRCKKDVSDASDGRIWREEKFQAQSFAFWRDLVRQIKSHPAIVAYNPLNEPHPDREYGFENPKDPKFSRWLGSIRGTTPDLDRFNRQMVAAIRQEDPDTPIILDGWFYAGPEAFQHNQPVADDRILYALHNLGPWIFTAFRINKGRFAYPARMPEGNGKVAAWTIENLKPMVAPVTEFATRNRIPPHRIIASEFWCDRRVEGAAAYMEDEVRIYNAHGWHWAFYSFRSTGSWTGLDYEIPPQAGLGKLYEAEKRGDDLEPFKPRAANPAWAMLQRELKRR